MACDGEDTISKQIAQHVAELIPDGATMQMGIGAIPDAVLGFLGNKKDLGIHSEMFSDGVVRLVEAGVITNARKSLHPGKIVVGFVLGTQALYTWVHDNPLCEFHRQEYVNDPFVIAQNDKMVAINSAIEVDLTGQVCADSIGTKLFSGVGGQLDFIYGASRSKGGVPIIALPSTATMRDGKQLSRLVNAQAGRRRDHQPQPRALRGHRVRRGGPVWQVHPPAGAAADRHCPSGLPQGPGEAGHRAALHLVPGRWLRVGSPGVTRAAVLVFMLSRSVCYTGRPREDTQ